MKRIQTIALTLAMTIAMLSCNDPLQIGTELLVEGDVDFVSTDTFTIEALTTQLDSTIAYQIPNFIFTNQRLGWLTDPIFGDHRSDLFVQLLPENFTRPEGAVDSVVLSIQFDTLDIYGNQDAFYDFEVFSLFGNFSRFSTFYTTDNLLAFTSLGNVNGYKPVQGDSIRIVEINSTGGLDTIEVPNQMRFNLNNSFGNTLMSIDSSDYTAIDTFLNSFSGLLIKPTTPNGAMLPLRTTNADAVGGLRNSKVSVYYKNSDGEPRQYDYLIGGATFTLHNHDYAEGSIDGSIDNIEASKELLYIKGAGGPTVSVKFPHILSLPKVVVNEAILEITTKELPTDDRSKYSLPQQLYTTFRQDSILVLTPDVNTAILAFRDIDLAGGKPEEVTSGGVTSIVYRFNLSDHLQNMIDGSVSNEIFIQLSQNSTGVERAVFNGVNDPESPIKLKITYTEI